MAAHFDILTYRKCPIFGGEIKTVRAENYEECYGEGRYDHIWVHKKRENEQGLQ